MAVVGLQVCRKSGTSCKYLNRKASPVTLFRSLDLSVRCYQGFEQFALRIVFFCQIFPHSPNFLFSKWTVCKSELTTTEALIKLTSTWSVINVCWRKQWDCYGNWRTSQVRWFWNGELDLHEVGKRLFGTIQNLWFHVPSLAMRGCYVVLCDLVSILVWKRLWARKPSLLCLGGTCVLTALVVLEYRLEKTHLFRAHLPLFMK